MRFHPEKHTGRNLFLLSTAAATVGAASIIATRSGETTEEYPGGACIPGKYFLTPDAPPTDDPFETIKIRMYETLLPNPLYGEYIKKDAQGNWRQAPCPETLSLDFIPIKISNSSENRIPIYRNPDMTPIATHFPTPQEIMTRSGIRVLGKIFAHPDFGRIWVADDDGRTYPGGLWIMLTDFEGSPIYPTNGSDRYPI